MFADESHPELDQRPPFGTGIENPHISHQRPDAVLIFSVIETAKLARHRESQMQKTALLGGPLESQASSEWRYVLEMRHLMPFVIGASRQ
jgi:hypothetical protein